MKLAWFTPLSEKSAIGRASVSIVRELAKASDLDVFHSESGPTHPVEAKTVYFADAQSLTPAQMAPYHLIFYNMGNNLPYHKEIFLASRRFPGVMILHDFVMHHFFAEYYLRELRAPSLYAAELQRLYGAPGAEAARRHRIGRSLTDSPDIGRFPFFESVFSGALGVVTHSEFLLRLVRAKFAGPTRSLHLPYEILSKTTPGPRESLDIPEGALLLLTLGHINPNKRIEAVLKALASHREIASRYFYLIAGHCEAAYRKRLDAVVHHHGLQSRVRFLGHIDDATLTTCLHHADICLNLRFPSIEGASASVIEQMLHSKPIVVSNAGFYQELPSDAVLKINPAHEHLELTAALRSLLDPAARAALSSNALTHATRTFRASEYARQIHRFTTEVRNARPLLAVSDRLSRELRRMNVSPNSPLLETLSSTCGDLFAGRAQSQTAELESISS